MESTAEIPSFEAGCGTERARAKHPCVAAKTVQSFTSLLVATQYGSDFGIATFGWPYFPFKSDVLEF